jgi:hypothetical protein
LAASKALSTAAISEVPHPLVQYENEMGDAALAVVAVIPMPTAEPAARTDIAVAVGLLRVVRPIITS